MNPFTRTEPICRDAQRRTDVLQHPVLNGIDFVEYRHEPGPPERHVLVVTFLKPLPDAADPSADGAYDLTTALHHIHIAGGTRIVGVTVLDAARVAERLEITVDRQGDFSTYWLALGWARTAEGEWRFVVPELDPQFSRAPIAFRAECPTDFDCRTEPHWPPGLAEEPLLDYLAKDYASFRQLLLDLIAQRNPDWLERNPADMGMALVELLAYQGDHLSYFQDAVGSEAFLETARQRASVKRHARLVDYAMHEGRNAWAALHVQVRSGGTLPRGTVVLSRIAEPVRNAPAPPGTVLAAADTPDEAYEDDPALRRSRVFETAFDLPVHPERNTLYVHTWGDGECCLPAGTRAAHLYAIAAADPTRAVEPALQAGDWLILEEVRNPVTFAAADADPARRHLVCLESVSKDGLTDPVYRDVLGAPDAEGPGPLQVRTDPAQAPLPLRRVTWRAADALPFPLWLSVRDPTPRLHRHLSVARGNVVLADHGRTVFEPRPDDLHPVGQLPPFPDGLHLDEEAPTLRLRYGPLTQQVLPAQPEYVVVQPEPVRDPGLYVVPAPTRPALAGTARDATPAVALHAIAPTGNQRWQVVPHLLDSTPFEAHFVADVDGQGRATLRFGDGQYGRRLQGVTRVTVTYRVGNGRAGNVAAEALAHLVRPTSAPAWPDVAAVRNPLPAWAGTDPESIATVRESAPAAFRAEQYRAVTEADYARAALHLEGVASAVAAFRWSGSWLTVLLGIDPRDPADLISLPGGRTRLAAAFAEQVRRQVQRYRLAGYDLEVRAGEYVALEVAVDVCVAPGHFRGDVLAAVTEALSNRDNPDGTRGFFHPEQLAFGQPVYLSALYAALEKVQGLDSAQVTCFQRFGHDPAGELDAGVIPIGPWQIARLDNDPNFQERGVLRLSADGGK